MTAASHRNRPELLGLTSLRFFAAMEVVLGHIEDDYPFPAIVRNLISGAYQAVTFFFVLSGFVLIYAYVHSSDGRMRGSKRQFWFSRFSRIAPAYYVALLLIMPLLIYGFLVAGTISPGRLAVTIAAAATFLPALFIPDVVAWNPPSWSLAVEACLYAVFPFLIAPCFRWPLGRSMTAAIGLVVISVLIRLAALRIDAGADLTSFLYHFPLFYFPHFVLGIVTARLFLFGPKLADRQRRIVFIVASSLLFLIALTNEIDWIYSDAVFAPLAAVLIIGATCTKEWPARILAWRPLIALGEASYAIYILHWPMRLWWQRTMTPSPVIGHYPWINCALYLTAVIATAVLAFYLIEQPMRRFIRRGGITDSAPRQKSAP